MDVTCVLVILFVAAVAFTVNMVIGELCKSPERKAAEAKEAEARRRKMKENRAREKARRQEKKENMPEKGCLQSMVEFGIACLFLMSAVIFAIMVIASS